MYETFQEIWPSDEEFTEETVNELTNGKGDDEDEQLASGVAYQAQPE